MRRSGRLCASLWLCVCVCRVVVARAVELSVCCRFRSWWRWAAALLQPVNTHSQCCQLNSDWNLALPRFAKIHFHCFSAIFTIKMPKQQRFVYMTSHTVTHIQWHTHTESALLALNRKRERERERTQESARASSAWQTHGFCFWQNTLGGGRRRSSSSKSNMDHLQLVCVCLVHSGARCSEN